MQGELTWFGAEIVDGILVVGEEERQLALDARSTRMRSQSPLPIGKVVDIPAYKGVTSSTNEPRRLLAGRPRRFALVPGRSVR